MHWPQTPIRHRICRLPAPSCPPPRSRRRASWYSSGRVDSDMRPFRERDETDARAYRGAVAALDGLIRRAGAPQPDSSAETRSRDPVVHGRTLAIATAISASTATFLYGSFRMDAAAARASENICRAFPVFPACANATAVLATAVARRSASAVRAAVVRAAEKARAAWSCSPIRAADDARETISFLRSSISSVSSAAASAISNAYRASSTSPIRIRAFHIAVNARLRSG